MASNRRTPSGRKTDTRGPKSRTRKSSSKAAATSKPILTPDWSAVEARPAATVQDCMFYLLGVQPQEGRRARIHESDSEHPLSKSYAELLRVTVLQIIARNPCLLPLFGEASRDRVAFQAIWLSLSHFVALARSPLSPYKSLIKPPEEFISLAPASSFLEGQLPPRGAVAAYETRERSRRPRQVPAADAQDAGEPLSDLLPLLPKTRKGERYAYPTLGLMSELLEEIARGQRDPGSVLARKRLDAENVATILHALAVARFPESLAFVQEPGTMAKHINAARSRLKAGNFT
jgi:hypothetical protein